MYPDFGFERKEALQGLVLMLPMHRIRANPLAQFPHLTPLCARSTGATWTGIGEGIMANTKKCGNAVCTCVPHGKDKYCSPHCEGVGDKTEIACQCGHGSCSGNVK